jgi:hypothetical protein
MSSRPLGQEKITSMLIRSPDSRRQPAAIVIPLPSIRIEPDPPGGWYVVRGSYGWLFGDRRAALDAHRELTQEARP